MEMSDQTDNKNALITGFKSCLNILRDNEGITGEKALRNMSYLLILKLIEPHLGRDIDIDNYEYDFSHIDDDSVEDYKNKLLRAARFSNLIDDSVINLPIILKQLWDDILANHPTTKNVFLTGKGFDIQKQSTYKKLIDKLNSLDLSNTEYDVLGNAYEEVIQDIMTGKVLGQFFTQPLVKKLMVKLIDPQIHPDGKIDICGDPTMGTGGFLITYLQYILRQASAKNIKPDWDFIKTEGLYGKEIEPDTYQLAVSNMLISSGHMFEKLDRGDSIREPITRKFDNILANPPFGIKGLKYNDFTSTIKDEYVPIKTDNAVSLFIQAIIYMLKINGKCCVVLPDGQDLFSKNNVTLVAIREYLMKTCDLKEVIYLPSGIFTYTSIKTCVFYFIKKCEGHDILETKIKATKAQSRTYKFSKTHQTTNVKFYDSNISANNIEEDSKTLLVEVPIEAIAKNAYSLNFAEYMETKVEQYENSIIVKTLGELCTFLPKSKRQASYGNKEGSYSFYTSSQICDKFCNEYDYESECLIIGTGGNANIKCNSKFSCSTDNLVIKIKEGLITKYIYYYLFINIEILKKGFIGVGLQHISKEYVSQIKIPVPPLERQREIVEYLDFIYEKTNKTSAEKITELKKLNEYCLNNQKIYGENTIKTLGKVCNFKNGKGIKRDKLVEGEYPVIGGGQSPMGLHDEYNTDDNVILCSSSGAYAGYISKYEKKVWASDCFSIIPKDDSINNDYLYYLLKSMQDTIYKKQTGAAQPHVYSKDLQDMKIPISSLERQKEIVEYCESNDALIKQLEKEIENNEKQARQFLADVIKMPVQDVAHFEQEVM